MSEKVSPKLLGCELKNCPPQEAITVDKIYFRVLKNGNLDKDSFIPRAYLPGKSPKDKEKCEECAISLSPKITDAKNLISTVIAFKNAKIASVDIKKDHGHEFIKINQTMQIGAIPLKILIQLIFQKKWTI